MHEQTSFQEHGKNFQEKLVYHLTIDKIFCDRIFEVLKVDYLELKHLQIYTNLIFEYRQKFKTHPTKDTINILLRTSLKTESDIIKKLIVEFFTKVEKDLFDSSDQEYIKEESLDFCRKQSVKEAMLLSMKKLKSSSFDDISKIINESLRKGEDNNLGHDYLNDLEIRYEKDASGVPITTGWEQMNKIMKGGLPKGKLGLVVAGTGRGKSMVLAHFAAQAVLNQYNVIYLTLELDDKEIGLRCDSVITKIPLDDLHERKEEVKKKLSELQLGKLYIKEYPTRSLSLTGVRALIEKSVRNDQKPDLLLVDYADLLKVNEKGDSYEILEHLFEELRGIAGEFNIAVWTASQTNRSGIDGKTSMDEGIGGSYGKLKVIDFGFRVIRNDEDKERNFAKFQVFKNRRGPDGIWFNVFMDLSRVAIDILEKHDLNKEQENKNWEFNERQKLNFEKRQKALEFLKNKVKNKEEEINA